MSVRAKSLLLATGSFCQELWKCLPGSRVITRQVSIESIGLDNAVFQIQRQFDTQASNERTAGVAAGFDAVALGYLLKAGFPPTGAYVLMQGVLVLGLFFSAFQAARVLKGTRLTTGPISPAQFSARLSIRKATVAHSQAEMLEILDSAIQVNEDLLRPRATQTRGALLWILAGGVWALTALCTQVVVHQLWR